MSSTDKDRNGNEVLEAVERICSAVASGGGRGAAEAADLKTVSDWRGRLAPTPADSTYASKNCNVSSKNCNVSSPGRERS